MGNEGTASKKRRQPPNSQGAPSKVAPRPRHAHSTHAQSTPSSGSSPRSSSPTPLKTHMIFTPKPPPFPLILGLHEGSRPQEHTCTETLDNTRTLARKAIHLGPPSSPSVGRDKNVPSAQGGMATLIENGNFVRVSGPLYYIYFEFNCPYS